MTLTTPANQNSLYDLGVVKKALELLLSPGQVTELRALDAVIAGEGRRAVNGTGYFDDTAKLPDTLGRIYSAKGIYIIPNPVYPALMSRAANRIKTAAKGESTADTNIVTRRWLLIDCDPKRPSGISSNDAEHIAAIERARAISVHLRECGWPEPILADSGNGAHLLYRIDVPTDDGGLVKRCLVALAERFGDEAVLIDRGVFNPARIWKLYGTRACKGDSTPERPHRMSCIISAPDEVLAVPSGLLESLAAEAPADARAQSNGKTAGQRPGQAFDVAAFIARHKLDVDGPGEWDGAQGAGRRWTFRTSPMCDHNDGAPFMLEHASGAITAGCHHDSCKGRWGWSELRAKFEPPTKRHSSFTDDDVEIVVPKLRRLSDVQPEEVRWLWPQRIALGKLTMMVGDPGLGKSFLTLDIAARVSTGAAWPDAPGVPRTPGGVVIMSAEDGLEDTIRPRLDAAKADVERITALTAIELHKPGETPREVSVDLARHLAALEVAIHETPDCKAVIVDPISAYLGDTDSHNNAEVRALLTGLAELAAKCGAAFIVVSHLNKSNSQSAIQRTTGSLAFVAAARGVWAVLKDQDDPTGQRRLMLPVKNNLGNDQLGLAYRLSAEHVGGSIPVVEWEPKPVDIRVDDLMAPKSRRGPKPDELTKAAEFLGLALIDGPQPATEMERAAGWNGISERTLDRAKAALKVESEKIGDKWYWKLLPKGARPSALKNLAPLASLLEDCEF